MQANGSNRLTKKDVFFTWLRWHLFTHIGTSTERLQALGFCGTMAPALKKLYPNKADLAKALKRHLILFNTQLNWGGIIGGAVLAMEEEKATGEAEVPDEVITGFKTGLMGPVAGIGDTVDWLTINPILISMFLYAAQGGSIWAALAPIILMACISTPIGYMLFQMGYKTGRSSIATLLHGAMVKKIITGTSILGLFMMGALSANFVTAACPVTFTAGGTTYVVQDLINSLAPGVLPLLVVMGVYFYLEKVGNKYLRALLILLVVGIVLGALGIL